VCVSSRSRGRRLSPRGSARISASTAAPFDGLCVQLPRHGQTAAAVGCGGQAGVRCLYRPTSASSVLAGLRHGRLQRRPPSARHWSAATCPFNGQIFAAGRVDSVRTAAGDGFRHRHPLEK